MERLELGSQLLCYSRQIANGIDYLHLRGYIHRDIAARNILVSKENICKVNFPTIITVKEATPGTVH